MLPGWNVLTISADPMDQPISDSACPGTLGSVSPLPPRSVMKRLVKKSVCVSFTILVLLVAGRSSIASNAGARLTELGVDVVRLKNGHRLRGFIVNRQQDGTLTMAVSRNWLQTANPTLYAQECQKEAAEYQKQLAELRDRIDRWRQERPQATRLNFFLDSERERIQKSLEQIPMADKSVGPDVPLMALTLSAKQVTHVFTQPLERRQVLLLAWREELESPETKTVRELKRELEGRGIKTVPKTVDLSDQWPPASQSEREWAARKALIEYAYVQALDFQGTGQVLLPTDDSPDNAAVMRLVIDLFSARVTEMLGELLDNPVPTKTAKKAPIQAATQAATAKHVYGIRVTRFEFQPGNTRIAVTTSFLARMSDQSWETVWSHREPADVSRKRPERVQRIAADPQVRQVIETFRQLGFRDGDSKIQQAMEYGAATMEALDNANARFFEFRDRYLNRLDGPPLAW